MNRYRFTKETVNRAKKFLKGTAKTQPDFLKKYKGEVKKNTLYLDGKKVITQDVVEPYLRKLIYKTSTPLTRDAAYYWISKSTIGISRAAIDAFLKKQRVIRESDNQQATSKRGLRKVNKKGQLHYDLVTLKYKDLPFEHDTLKDPIKKSFKEQAEGSPDVLDRSIGFFFGMTDALTSLSFYHFVPSKHHKHVTPVAEKGFKWFSQRLGIPISKMTAYSDSGAEWELKKYRSWGVTTILVKKSAIIENKNSHFQRVFFRLAKMLKTKSIPSLTDQAMKVVNRTQSSITKKAPIENIKEPSTELAKKYNRKRGKDSGIKIRRAPLKKGDKVRIQKIFPKDKGVGFKAYKSQMWSKRFYRVQEKRGNRYRVNGKLMHRDELRAAVEYDQESEKLLAARDK